jgi:phosphopantetheine--protein transferase-like protein
MQKQIFNNKVLIEIIDSRDYSRKEVEEIYSGLSDSRKEKADSIKSDNNRTLSILAGYRIEELLRSFLKYDDEKLIFSTNESGKPILISKSEVPSFSISHSGNFAAVAVSLDRNINVGIDIEDYSNKKRSVSHMRKIADRFFSEDEKKQLDTFQITGSGSVKEEHDYKINFLKIWTMKEAAMKALEQPLITTLHNEPYSQSDIRLFQNVTEEYLISVYIS